MSGWGRGRVVLAAIRWRLGISIATLGVATLAIASATGSPLFLGTAEDSALRSALAATSVSASGLTLTSNLIVFGQEPRSPAQRLRGAVSKLPAYNLNRWFGPGVETTQIAGSLPPDPYEPNGYVAQLVVRENACDHLSFVTGGCPAAPGAVAISDRTAVQLRLALSSTLVFRLAGQPAANLTISGIYKPPDPPGGYWWNVPFFNFAPGVPTLAGATPFFVDALFVEEATIAAIPPSQAAPTVSEEIPLAAGSVDRTQVHDLAAALRRYAATIGEQDDVVLSTQLTTLLDRLSTEEQDMSAIAGVTGAQLLVLALLALYGVIARSSEGREPEVALAKLHGYRPGGILAVGLLEPLVLVTAGLVLGVLLAWLAIHAMVGRLFVPVARVDVDTLTVLAAAVAYAAVVVAVVASGRQLFRRPLAEQLRASRRSQPGRWVSALDLVVAALAAAGVLELVANGVLSGGHADPLALIAPGLLSVATAIGAIRIVPLLCRPLLHPTARSPFVGTFLAVRSAYRRPATLRTMAVLAIGSSLTTFCVLGWNVGDRNRAEVAAFRTGADQVLTVSAPAGTDLEAAVRRADPGGRQAMAAVFYATNSGDLLAVDASRLAAVAAWPQGLAAVGIDSIAAWLLRPSLAALQLDGSALRLTITGSEQGLGIVTIRLQVQGQNGALSDVDLGQMQLGSHEYVASLPAACTAGCRLVDFAPRWQLPPPTGAVGPGYYAQNATVTLGLGGIDVGDGLSGPWRATDPAWRGPSRWAPDAFTSVSGGSGDSAPLVMSFNERYNERGLPTIAYQDAVESVPAVVTPDLVSLNGGGVSSRISIDGLDGRGVILDGAYQVPVLPRIGTSGAIVDLKRMLREATGPLVKDAIEQVWLSSLADPSITSALHAQGISVIRADRAVAAKRSLDAGGLALAYQLLVFAGLTSLLLAVGATAFNVLVAAPRRAQETAVLRAMGVRDGALARGLFGEQMLVMGTAAFVGLVTGAAAALITLPVVPEIAGDQLLPLQFQLSMTVLVGLAVLLLATSGVIAFAGAIWVLRLAVPARLRLALA